MNKAEAKIDVFPPHGFVRLIRSSGDELDVVNAARVSFHNEVTHLGSSDIALLNYLLKNKHGSPFEQGFIAHWHIRLPIFVMREWVRHRIGFSVNEESGRYVKMRSDFFEPTHLRTQQGKPGAYTFEAVTDPALLEEFLDDLCKANQAAWDFYEKWMARGIAKEQCRIALPLNLYTEIRWTSNSRSLMNFLELRNAKDAMFEIREYARACEHFFALKMPNVHRSFEANGRIAP